MYLHDITYVVQGQNYFTVPPNQTPHQHDAGDETTMIYSDVKKVKEATQTTEEMQRDEGELADQRDKDGKESAYMDSLN